VNKKRAIISTACLLGIVAVTSVGFYITSDSRQAARNLTDEALLALIKNDHKAFAAFLDAGGNLHNALPKIDGVSYTVAEGLSYFERPHFAQMLHERKVSYLKQNKDAPFDIMTISITKNNPELLNQLVLETPDFNLAYGKKGWNLLHLASASCAHKLTSILHEKGKLNWNTKAGDGATALTLAAENDCLPMLSYWKEQGADFKLKDGRGKSALAILKGKKDAALMAFAQSFEVRVPAAVTVQPNFYKKRKIPKDQMIDYSSMIEPEERPLEATETAELSEFAD
jgi:ankyrin repeat protein